jgi:hypothetical protein
MSLTDNQVKSEYRGGAGPCARVHIATAKENAMLYRWKGGVVRAASGIGLVLLVCGFLTAQDVKSNYMPGTDFSKYKTYKWIEIEGVERPDQIVDQQIRQAVDAQLVSKGLTKTDDEKANLYVGYQVSVTQQREWSAYGMGGGVGWGGGMATATSSTIQVGTLGLDFYDPGPKQLIWRGQATKTLNPSKDPQKNQERLNKAVAKLLKDFPPKPGK